jgi:transposase
MRREPPLPRELRDQIPPPVQAALWLVVEGCERHIAGLEAEVRALKGGAQESTARLGQSPQNSSRPPSSGGPQVKRKPPRAPSGRERGGQPGHPVHQRALLPPERVDEVVVRKPGHCRRCGGALQGSDAAPLRHQVVEVPPPVPYVTEYQLHRLARAGGGITTCGALPPGVPAHSYGPRLASLVGLCGGAYRVSKRMVASFCAEVWGAPLALGEVGQVEQTAAAALDPAVQEARAYVQAQDVDVDGTPWREQQRRGRLWVVVTQWGSVFCIRTSRGAEVLWELLGGNTGAC